jgi:hypothetical protein
MCAELTPAIDDTRCAVISASNAAVHVDAFDLLP